MPRAQHASTVSKRPGKRQLLALREEWTLQRDGSDLLICLPLFLLQKLLQPAKLSHYLQRQLSQIAHQGTRSAASGWPVLGCCVARHAGERGSWGPSRGLASAGAPLE